MNLLLDVVLRCISSMWYDSGDTIYKQQMKIFIAHLFLRFDRYRISQFFFGGSHNHMAFYRCLFTPGSRYRRPALLVNNLANK